MSFESLSKAQYISLKTFRKSGDPLPTPVWFAEEGGKLYVMTLANAGKVKRIRNNNSVEVAPCDMRGNIAEGVSYIKGIAKMLPAGEEANQANQKLNRKYGLFKRLFDLAQRSREKVYIEISPV